ncbi:hypothetical protein [Kribbella sp. NPDC023855]|jgi:hypothetical protein|uniref:hypothetical protein n=1 Tax=unclassified Kribbella TaxID=2644121 RepID=UPI003403EB17
MDEISGRPATMLRPPRRHLKVAAAAGPRRFHLLRHVDVSGVSGTGVVAEGVEWSDGTVTLHWGGRFPTTTVWQDGIDALLTIHGHNGATTIRWIDN